MPISNNFIICTKRAFSYLSASCPEIPANSKKGIIKIPEATITKSEDGKPNSLTVLKVISMIKAFLTTLSLNAPRNWVINKGRKRLSLNK